MGVANASGGWRMRLVDGGCDWWVVTNASGECVNGGRKRAHHLLSILQMAIYALPTFVIDSCPSLNNKELRFLKILFSKFSKFDFAV